MYTYIQFMHTIIVIYVYIKHNVLFEKRQHSSHPMFTGTRSILCLRTMVFNEYYFEILFSLVLELIKEIHLYASSLNKQTMVILNLLV